MHKLVKFLLDLGVTTGPTFRAEIEDGVGPVLMPNPAPNRMNPRTVALPAARRIDGNWTARRVYLVDRFPFLQ